MYMVFDWKILPNTETNLFAIILLVATTVTTVFIAIHILLGPLYKHRQPGTATKLAHEEADKLRKESY
jgi:hypothetical protein